MTLLDIVLIVFLFIGTFKGLKNGLLVEFASFVGLLLGLWAALRFSDVTRDFFGNHLGSNPKTAYIFAFIITFLAVVIGVRFLAKAITRIADFSGLGILNAIGGGLFGFVRTLLVLGVLLNIFDKANVMNALVSEEKQEKSVLYGPIKASAEIVYPFLKEQLYEIRIKMPDNA